MFDTLSEKLDAVFKKLRGRGRLTEEDVQAAMREVRLALLEADVNFKVVKDFVAAVRERAVGQDVLQSLTPGQQVIRVVRDELANGTLYELAQLPGLTEEFHAVTTPRTFPNPLLRDVLGAADGASGEPVPAA